MENNQTNTYMEETNSELVHTYNRFPVVLDHGEGVYLYDTEGKKYLDFAAGIAVCGLENMLTKKVPDVMSSLLWKILSMEEVWEHCLLPEQSITERHLSH